MPLPRVQSLQVLATQRFLEGPEQEELLQRHQKPQPVIEEHYRRRDLRNDSRRLLRQDARWEDGPESVLPKCSNAESQQISGILVCGEQAIRQETKHDPG